MRRHYLGCSALYGLHRAPEIPHDSKPMNEFFNPALFPMIYPTLYPYGLGGFEDSYHEVRVSLERHVKHLFNLSDRQFQEHHLFMCVQHSTEVGDMYYYTAA